MAEQASSVLESEVTESVEDTESNVDSDSSEDSSPLKQAWGPRDIKYDGRKFDFANNFPEDGEQYLLAVMNERKVTPKWVAADVSKLKPKRKVKAVVAENNTSETQQVVPTVEGGTVSSQQKEDDDDVELELETLQLEDEISMNLSGWSQLKRFRPTPQWRANQLTNFTFIRTKFENTRQMMADGSFYLVTATQTFEKDPMYWLRYCFGTSNSSKMIELKRAKKSRRLLAKKIRNCGATSQKAEGIDAENSDEETQRNNPADGVPEKGHNSDSEDAENESEEEGKEEDSVLAGTTGDNVSPANEENEFNIEQEVPTLAAKSSTSRDSNISGTYSESNKSKISENSDTMTNESEENDLTSCFDELRESTKLYGHFPSTTLLLSIPQNLLTFLLSVHLKWLRDFGIMTKKQGTWIYAIMCSLEIPFDSSVISDLRCVALQCARIRDHLLAHVKKVSGNLDGSSLISCPCSASEDLESACDFALLEKNGEYSHEDVICTCNLIISLVVDYYVQKDLDELVICVEAESTSLDLINPVVEVLQPE